MAGGVSTMDHARRVLGAAETPGPGQLPHNEAQSQTRMAYVADLLAELQDMASAEGHGTLAGILALARAEALTKSR